MRKTKEDRYAAFWGFVKHYVKNRNVSELNLKKNEYYVIQGKKVFGIK